MAARPFENAFSALGARRRPRTVRAGRDLTRSQTRRQRARRDLLRRATRRRRRRTGRTRCVRGRNAQVSRAAQFRGAETRGRRHLEPGQDLAPRAGAGARAAAALRAVAARCRRSRRRERAARAQRRDGTRRRQFGPHDPGRTRLRSPRAALDVRRRRASRDRTGRVVGLDRRQRVALPMQRRRAHAGDGANPGRVDAARAARARLCDARASVDGAPAAREQPDRLAVRQRFQRRRGRALRPHRVHRAWANSRRTCFREGRTRGSTPR